VNSNLAIVFFSAIVATFNPSLLAAVTVMVLLPHPKKLMLAYLLGAYTASVAAGLAIVLALHGSGIVKHSKHTISPSEDIAAGAVLLAIAFVLATRRDARLRSWHADRKAAKAREKDATQPWQQRTLNKGSFAITFAVGAMVSFPGVSYLNALDHIVKLGPPFVPILLLILYFCVMQQLLLELPLLAYVFAPQRTQTTVVRIKAWLERRGRGIATIALTTIGALVVAHGLVALA
jgi:Sap, sulfolipid-1-addressing protein